MSCKGCAYAVLLSGDWCCDYLGVTGHRRPCPPGEGCTVRAEGDRDSKRIWKETKPMKGRSWDTTKARTLYDEGLLDGAIASELGIKATTVSFWRRTQGLPSNWEKQKKQNAVKAPEPPVVPPTVLEPTAPDPPPPVEHPLALPKARGQIELSVELNGCAFALRAPDLEGAAWAYEYAGRLLSDMKKAAELVRGAKHG